MASVYFAGRVEMGPQAGVRLAIGLLSILFAHEMGHYLACRYYGVDATLPFFIPAPWIPAGAVWMPLSFIGTFGALIRIRSPFPHRRALFDIGIAGPLAGFVVALPVLVMGLLEARVVSNVPTGSGLELGEPLLFQAAAHLLRGDVGPGMTLTLGPLGLAAWFGLFVTALNLMPAGQLDGGHVSYALFRGWSVLVSRATFLGALVLVFHSPMWLLWTILLLVVGRPHPPTLADHQPIGRARQVVALVGLAVFVLCFSPNPILVSWSDLFANLRELF